AFCEYSGDENSPPFPLRPLLALRARTFSRARHRPLALLSGEPARGQECRYPGNHLAAGVRGRLHARAVARFEVLAAWRDGRAIFQERRTREETARACN